MVMRDTLAGVVRERGGWPRSSSPRLMLFLEAKPTGRIRLRATSLAEAKPRVDREAGILRGVSCMQAGPAKGHGVDIDQTTLAQCAMAINAAGANGLKCRLGHPEMCSDAIGTQMGRMRGPARVEGDRVLADLHLSKASANAPKGGNLRQWALDSAEEDPASMGMSVVTGDGTFRAWQLADGTEIDARDDSLYVNDEDDGGYFRRPDHAISETPVLRVGKLDAVDLVDDPAANREGLFAAVGEALALSAPNAAGDDVEVFAAIDEALTSRGIPLASAAAIAQRYFAAKGRVLRPALATPPAPPAAPAPAAPTQKERPMISLAALKAIKADFPEFAADAIDMAEGDKDEAAIRTALAGKRSTALQAEVDRLKADKVKDAEKLAAANAEVEKHKTAHDRLAALGAGAIDPGGAPPADEAAELSTEQRIDKEWLSNAKLRAEWTKVGLGKAEFAAARRMEMGKGFGTAPAPAEKPTQKPAETSDEGDDKDD